MWKLLVTIAFFTPWIQGGPLENGTLEPAATGSSGIRTTEETCRCPSPSTSSSAGLQIESLTGSNRPVPSAVSNTGINSLQNVVLHGMPCVCSLGPSRIPIRDDYTYTPGVGSHKLHTRALPWNDARKMCNEEGGHLAIVNSVAEAQVCIMSLSCQFLFICISLRLNETFWNFLFYRNHQERFFFIETLCIQTMEVNQSYIGRLWDLKLQNRSKRWISFLRQLNNFVISYNVSYYL